MGEQKMTDLNKFQSTRPRGARLEYPAGYKWELEFQSTRPRGARLIRIKKVIAK